MPLKFSSTTFMLQIWLELQAQNKTWEASLKDIDSRLSYWGDVSKAALLVYSGA